MQSSGNHVKRVVNDFKLDYSAIERELTKKEFVHHPGCLKNMESTYTPIISFKVARKLMEDATVEFKKDAAVLKLNRKKTRVVGDLHGALDDFSRYVEIGYYDLQSTFLFLGNYVDHGPNSVAVVCLLCFYKARYPNRFFFLRGNHEFALINGKHGFLEECIRVYGIEGGQTIFLEANELFREMPVAAIVQDRVWFAHGGISHYMLQGRDFLELVKKRPETAEEHQLFMDILWSDPSTVFAVDGKTPILFVKSGRTEDALDFTVPGLTKVLEACDFDFIGRGHQVKENGFEFFCGTKCVTLFGRTNNDESGNMGCQMIVHETLQCEYIVFINMDPVPKGKDEVTQDKTLDDNDEDDTKENSKDENRKSRAESGDSKATENKKASKNNKTKKTAKK